MRHVTILGAIFFLTTTQLFAANNTVLVIQDVTLDLLDSHQEEDEETNNARHPFLRGYLFGLGGGVLGFSAGAVVHGLLEPVLSQLEDIPIPVITLVVGGASAIALATRNQPENLRGKIVVGGVVGIASIPVLFVAAVVLLFSTGDRCFGC